MTNKDIIRVIKEQTGIKNFRDGMLAAHFLCRPLSRICSVWFINHNIKPNQITILMILFGILGSLMFAIPNIWTKIVGYIFWILWFTMDCSDGQVARYTKTFSKHGTEMDYMAHLIDHSVMNIAIWATFIEMNIINPIILSSIFIIWISAELVSRNIIAFRYYDKRINPKSSKIEKKQQSWFKYLWGNILLYPTFIVCFSWIIIIDYVFRNRFSLYLLIIWVSLFFIMFVRNILITIKWFYRE